MAIGLTVAFAIFVLAALSLVLAGPASARYLGDAAGLGDAVQVGLADSAVAAGARPRVVGDRARVLLRS